MNRMRYILGGTTGALGTIQKQPKEQKMDCFYLMMQVELALALDGIETDALPIHSLDDLSELDIDHIVNLATGFQD